MNREVETNINKDILELKWRGLGFKKRLMVGLGLIFNGNIQIKWKESKINYLDSEVQALPKEKRE